jgi:5'-methylthioadenosine phosphorylase
MAMVTDYDCWKADEAHVTVDIVLEYLRRNADMACRIVAAAVSAIPKEPTWSCHSSLGNAIMTDRKLWPAGTKKQLAPILKKYL